MTRPKRLAGGDYPRVRFPGREELKAMIVKAGWPLRCPRCEVETVIGGWDVESNQCRECWKSDVHGKDESRLEKEIRSDYKHPQDDWCRGTKANGERCTFDAEIDGYCKVHWRQAVDRRAQDKPPSGSRH